MDRRGMSAVADAVMFIMLISIAAGMIAAWQQHDGEPDLTEPSEIVETVFAGRVAYSDLGIEGSPGGIAPMNRVAYVSLGNGDGRFADLLEKALAHVYQWEGQYYLEISCSAGSDSRGTPGADPWKAYEGTYQSGYGDDIRVSVRLYR